MSQFRLSEGIIALSESATWDAAKTEWSLESIYHETEPDTCLCGHFPIIEICILKNRENGHRATVGNCCVKKFIGLPSDKIFQAIKRVKKDAAKSLNAETIQHAYSKSWISDWERGFYLDIMLKRNLSAKQDTKKQQINAKILERTSRRGA